MSIRSPDIGAEYLQIRNLELVRGDTFGMNVRLRLDGTPAVVTENSCVTFAIYDRGFSPVLLQTFGGEDQDEEGYIRIALLPSQTATLKKTQYTYELEWQINPESIYTLMKGNISIISDKII